MVSFRSLALLAAVTAVNAQEMSSLKPCAVDCYNRALADFSRFGCASAADVSCMCSKPDWGFSIRDCAAAACEPGYADTVTAAANALCATATVARPTASQTSSTPPPTTAPPTTTTPAPTASSSSSASSSTTSAPSTAAKLAPSSSTTSSSTSSASQTSSKGSSSTASHAPASSNSAAAAPASSKQGMSTASKIGVGVGLTVAFAVVIGAAIYFFIRRRQNSRVPAGPKHWKISEPMTASSNRGYALDNNSYETGLSELEMKSRRYEDMVPRQKPRHMV